MSFQKEHINCFVVCSGDSDFSPLVSKLKENNKYVIGLGVKNSTSDLLIENCDEFIFYEDLVRGQQRSMPVIANVPEKVQECFALLVDSVLALQRENKEILWGSMVKETMKRKRPSFNETYYGFRTFSHLLEDAQRRGIVTLRRDQRSGSYIVEDLGSAASSAAVSRNDAPAQGPPAVGPRLVEPAPAVRPAEPAAATATATSPVSVSATETETHAAAARGPRRRRGRGRRRSASPLAAGAFPDSASNGGGEYALGPDSDDAEDGDDDLAADAAEDAAHAAASAEPQPPTAQPEATRPGFSFFSWIRREPHHEPQAEPPPRTSEPGGKPRDGE
jgi:hypothetical protein